jgi:hypothetical protein
MGGNAFANVKPIKKEHIPDTVATLGKAVPLGSKYALLGSAGKKPISGDLDIAIDMHSEENKQRLFLMLKKVVNDHDVRKFGGNFSFPWVVPATGEKVQVDFIFGDPEWLSFYYHSPSSTESEFKGTHRNVAISALAGMTDREELSSETNDEGMCVDVIRWKWSSKTGLSKVRRVHNKRKDGKGYTKTAKETQLEGPYYCPLQVSSILFDNKLDDKYLTSAEKVFEAIKIVYKDDTEKQQQIFERIACNYMEHHDLKTKSWNYPAEISCYIK